MARRRTGASSPRSASLEVTGNPPTTWRKDPSIFRGQRVVADAGSSPLSTSVRRNVYDASGKLLYEDVWYSSYRGEKKIVLVGTKVKPQPEPQPAEKPDGEGAARRGARAAQRLRRASSSPLQRLPRRARTETGPGRIVFASTTACIVQPSATSSPSCVTAYS